MKFQINHEVKSQETKPPEQAGLRSGNAKYLYSKASRFEYGLENR